MYLISTLQLNCEESSHLYFTALKHYRSVIFLYLHSLVLAALAIPLPSCLPPFLPCSPDKSFSRRVQSAWAKTLRVVINARMACLKSADQVRIWYASKKRMSRYFEFVLSVLSPLY